MKSREISRSKIGPFSLACTDPYIDIGWEYQSTISDDLALITSSRSELCKEVKSSQQNTSSLASDFCL